MYLYWSIFSLIAILSIINIKVEKRLQQILRIFFLFFLTFFVGFRYKVGGDWDIYLYDFYHNVEYFNLLNFEFVRDFGYEFISYISYNLNIGIYGLNLILAFIFIYSLNKFATQFNEKNYWLIFLISFPYLILIVAMGYTRQATALAFSILALCSIENKKLYSFFILSIFAILFHKSSVLMTALIFISYFKINLKNITIFTLLVLISFLTIFPEIDRISGGYLNEFSQYQSPGVKYRIALNILSGVIFVFFYKKLSANSGLDKLLVLILIFNLALLFFINNYSTLVDRIIIYFSLIQIIIFSKLYLITPNFKILINIGVIMIYSLLLFIWINFSNHSYAWLPYQNIIFLNIK